MNKKLLFFVIFALLVMWSNVEVGFAATYKYNYDGSGKLSSIFRDDKPYMNIGYDSNGNMKKVNNSVFLEFERASVATNGNLEMVLSEQPRIDKGFYPSTSSKNLLMKHEAQASARPISSSLVSVEPTSWEGNSSILVGVPVYYGTGSIITKFNAVDKVLPSSKAGAFYTFTAYIRSDGGKIDDLYYINGQNTTVSCGSVGSISFYIWKRVSCKTQATVDMDGLVRVRFGLTVSYPSMGRGVYIDGLQLEEGSTATSWVLPSYNGKALKIENSTVNMLGSKYWSSNAHNWINYLTDGAEGITESINTTTQRFVIEKTDVGTGQWGYKQSNSNTGEPTFVTDSFLIRKISADDGSTFKMYSNYKQSDGSSLNGIGIDLDLSNMFLSNVNGGSATIKDVGDGWFKVTFKTSSRINSAGDYYYLVEGAPAKIVIKNAQKESGDTATSFTPFNRAPEKLYITTSANSFDGREGTWEQLFYVTDEMKSEDSVAPKYAFHLKNINGADALYFDITTWKLTSCDDTGQCSDLPVSSELFPDGWHRLSVTWKKEGLNVYIDGQAAGAIENPKLSTKIFPKMMIGSKDGEFVANTFFDDIRYSKTARSAESIASELTEVPLPTDAYTIFKTNFDELY